LWLRSLEAVLSLDHQALGLRIFTAAQRTRQLFQRRQLFRPELAQCCDRQSQTV